MSVLSFFRRRLRKDTRPPARSVLLADYDHPPYNWDEDEPVTDALRTVESGYQPHGIDTPQTLAEITAQAHAEAAANVRVPSYVSREAYEARTTPVAATPPPGPPPPMPYPSGLSRVMVGQIAYPDPADLTLEKDRAYRDMLRRVGVATGTRTSLEDTCTWALPALEPGDGTGTLL